MKERFLALVEKVKQSGVAEKAQAVSTAEELLAIWQEFSDGNQELYTKTKDWASEFKEEDSYYIFMKEERIQNPLEIVAVICIIKDRWVSEDEIFENPENLREAIEEIDTDLAYAIADYMCWGLLSDISIENLFPE